MDDDELDSIFDDEEFADKFFDVLDAEGMAASVDEGLVVAFTKERIDEMLKVITKDDNDHVVILIRKRPEVPEALS